MKIRANNQSMSQNVAKINIFDLLLIGEVNEKHYVLIKDFNTFTYDYTMNLE